MINFYLVAILIAILIMTCAFMIERRTGSSGYIDTIWSLCVGALGVLAIFWDNFDNVSLRSLIIGALVFIWALRLGGHIFLRTSIAPNDPRYAELLKQWGNKAGQNLFWFLQIQAICAFILAASVRIAVMRPSTELGVFDYGAILIAIIAIAGEAIADNQLRQYRKSTVGGVCNIGLWKYSRHPNYFFEFLFWCAISMFAIDTKSTYLIGFAAIIAPLMMYYLLNYASGIPYLEAHMLKSRGEIYKQYQRNTRPFLPWPRNTIKSD